LFRKVTGLEGGKEYNKKFSAMGYEVSSLVLNCFDVVICSIIGFFLFLLARVARNLLSQKALKEKLHKIT